MSGYGIKHGVSGGGDKYRNHYDTEEEDFTHEAGEQGEAEVDWDAETVDYNTDSEFDTDDPEMEAAVALYLNNTSNYESDDIYENNPDLTGFDMDADDMDIYENNPDLTEFDMDIADGFDMREVG
jgi:hypothetical protein